MYEYIDVFLVPSTLQVYVHMYTHKVCVVYVVWMMYGPYTYLRLHMVFIFGVMHGQEAKQTQEREWFAASMLALLPRTVGS